MGASASKSRSRSESGPTAGRRAQSADIYRAAQEAAGSTPQGIGDAQGYYGGATRAGQAGIDALSGNAAAQQQFMNPYQTGVIDRMNEQFGVQNQMTQNSVNDAATRSGAFGGSRHGVATGVALGENARNQGMQMAGLLNSGFNASMDRAGQVAGLGMGAAGAGANLGMTAGSPALWRMNVLKQGVEGQPYQTYSKGRQTNIGGGFQWSKAGGFTG